jgi:hypothetical protein
MTTQEKYIMGQDIASQLEWDGKLICDVFLEALTDANFHTLRKQLEVVIEKEFTEDAIEVYDIVEVPEPFETDIFNHSFVGTVIDITGDIVTVEDSDGDCFDIGIWRLTKI